MHLPICNARMTISRSIPAVKPARRKTALASLNSAVARAAVVLLLVAMLAVAIVYWLQVFGVKIDQASNPDPADRYQDYVVFYSAGRLVADGQAPKLYDVATISARETEALGHPANGPANDGILPYFNPPFVAAVLAPLALLPLGGFSAVLFVLVLLSIVAAGCALDRFLSLERPRAHATFWFWFLSLGSVGFVALESQVSMLPLLGLLGFVFYETRNRPSGAGASLALALVKPHLVLLPIALLVWKRQWPALRAFLGVACVLTLVSIAVAGPGVLISYPRILIQSTGWDNEKGIVIQNMYGWSGFYARLAGSDTAAHQILTWASSGLVLVLWAFTCRGGWQALRDRLPALIGLTTCCSLLISVPVYRQDLALLALAVACGIVQAKHTGNSMRAWYVLAASVWLAQYFGPDLLLNHGVNVQTPALLLTTAALAWQARPLAMSITNVQPDARGDLPRLAA